MTASLIALGATITEQTGISVGVIIAVVTLVGGALVIGVFRAGAILTRIDNRMNNLERSIGGVWTVENHRLWAERLDSANGTLVVPNVDDVIRRK